MAENVPTPPIWLISDVRITATIRVTVHDAEVVRRVVENVEGWREQFYDIRTEAGVLEHLAFNLGLNGSRLSHLDGWADLPDNAAEATIRYWDNDGIEAVEPP